MNSSSYVGPSSVAAKYESDDRLDTCCIMKPPLHVMFRPGVYTNNNPSNTILVTFSTSRFWVCGFTNHVDLSNLHQAIKPKAEIKRKIADLYNIPQKCQVHICTHVPFLHPCAIFAPMCQAFKIQPKLHNSADQGIC